MNKKNNGSRGERMDTPFHSNVPMWMIKYLAHAKCSKCDNPIHKTNITAIGVRGQDNCTVPYVEYQCPKCDHRAMKSFGGHIKGTIEEVCYMLLEEVQNKRRLKQARSSEIKGHTSGQMTDEEVKKFLDNMDKCKTFVELLKEIGATQWLEDKRDEG